MSEGSDVPHLIDTLQASIEDIRHRYNLLLKEEDDVYVKYRDAIDRSTRERRKRVASYRKNESAAARRVYDGSVYEINDDLEHDFVDLEDSMTDYIACKYEFIRQTFPDTAALFATHTECPFIQALLGETGRPESHATVHVSNKPLVTAEELKRAVAIAGRKHIVWRTERNTLVGGDMRFPIGTSLTFVYGKANPIDGKISGVTDQFVEFTLNDGRTARVPIKALNMKLCTFKR